MKNALENLFNFAHANGLQMTSDEEDQQFLIAQREPGRRGAIRSLDISLSKKENNKRNRRELVEQRQRSCAESRHLLQSLAVF